MPEEEEEEEEEEGEEGEEGEEDEEEDDLVMSVTPENLPVLLEYLKQCEERLGEWRTRVQSGGWS